MQTLTIKVDDSYLEQILTFLQQIPKNKREIFQHKNTVLSSKNRDTKEPEDELLTLLANGPTISQKEATLWEQDITKGYKSWNIQEF